MTTRLRKPARSKRKGVEAAELAIVAPIILLITFGTLETVEGILLNKKVEVAAHEGARVAIEQQSTSANVRDAVYRYMDSRGIHHDVSSVSITPAPETAPMLTPVTVRVSVDTNENLRMPIRMYRYWAGRTIEREVTMFKEFSFNEP